MGGAGDARHPSSRRPASGPSKRFFYVAAANGTPSGPYPSFDIARAVAEHHTFCAVQAAAAGDLAPAFGHRLDHARTYFGCLVARWLETGMPSRRPMPPAADIEAIEPRILARNGVALTRYLGQTGGFGVLPLYDRLARRYLWAVHGVESAWAGSDVRVFMEPVHHSQALRQLAQSGAGRDARRHFQVVCATTPPRGASVETLWITRAQAVAMLRRHASFYRGFNHELPRRNFTPAVRGKWDRFCAGAVILPGVERHELFDFAAGLLAQAAIEHGVDGGDNGVALRWMLLHLAQWCLASERAAG